MPRKPLILAAIALCAILGIAADLGYRAYTRPQYAVLVEGHLLGALRNPAEADEALKTVLEQIPQELRLHVNLPDKMTVRHLESAERQQPLTTPAAIQEALVKTVPSLAYATAITVNGQDVVAVADVETARQVKETILEEYRATVLRDVKDVEQLAFQEKIDWRPKVIPTERVRTLDEAIRILKYGTDRLVTYEVKRGDTGWDIARSYNISTEQLAKANPDTDLETLQIGQSLNVTFREPYVHTLSVSKKVVTEPIPFTETIQPDATLWPWQYRVVKPGVPGQREYTLREYRENGQVVKTEVLENKVLKEPAVQVARQGTKQIPDMGTGSLVYPVAGTITSYFGPRWGSMHTAIDIAASTGTPILAADSGMVVYKGYNGNYGYMLKIDHGSGKMVTWYAHLSAYNVDLGDSVSKGDVIGYVGNTGFSTGPHLHYEVHVDGTPVNPLNFYQ